LAGVRLSSDSSSAVGCWPPARIRALQQLIRALPALDSEPNLTKSLRALSLSARDRTVIAARLCTVRTRNGLKLWRCWYFIILTMLTSIAALENVDVESFLTNR